MTPHNAVLIYFTKDSHYIYRCPIKVCLKWKIKITKSHSSHEEVGRNDHRKFSL